MLKEYLSNIADKFRTYLDTTELINAQDFAGKIEDVAVRHNQLGFTNGYNLGLEEGTEQGKPLGKLELLQDSEYMNAKVSGTAISVNDVNAVEHSVGCKVRSKNLLPYSQFNPTRTINGITFTNNGDGSITLNGTATAEAIFPCVDETKAVSLKAGTYTLSGALNLSIWLQGKIVEDDSLPIYNQDRGGIITLNYDFSFRFNIRVSSGTVCENVVIKPQLELGSTATEYTPYVEELGGIEVSRLGKNLFDISQISSTSQIINNGNGTLTINGNAISSGKTLLQVCPSLKVGDTAVISLRITNAVQDGKEYAYIYLYGCNKTWKTNQTMVITQEMLDSQVFLYSKWYTGTDIEGSITTGTVSEFQVEIGSTATPYEPYIEPTVHTANADGNVYNGIKSISPNMTLLTNNNGVVINANYLRDIDTYIDNLKTNVALSGGEA